jgi:hypothetical protein
MCPTPFGLHVFINLKLQRMAKKPIQDGKNEAAPVETSFATGSSRRMESAIRRLESSIRMTS